MVIHDLDDLDDDWGTSILGKPPNFDCFLGMSWEVLGRSLGCLGMSLGDLELFEKVTSSCTCPWATASTVAEEPDQTYTKFRPWKGSSFTMFHLYRTHAKAAQKVLKGLRPDATRRIVAAAKSIQQDQLRLNLQRLSAILPMGCATAWLGPSMNEHLWKTTPFPWFSIIFLIFSH